MRKRKSKKRNLIIAIFVMFIALGYALLSTDLSIIGNYSVKKITWDIHFENAQVTSNSVGSNPSITNDDTKVSYTFTLDSPEEYYEFTVDAVNDGTMDGIVSGIENGVYDSTGTDRIEVPEYLEYSIINTTTNQKLKVGDILTRKTTNTYKVKVNIKSGLNVSQMPQENTSMRFKLSIDFDQKKSDSDEKYNYYDGEAVIADATPTMWTYEITDSENHEAKITGFNISYNDGRNYDYDRHSFIDYCYNEYSDYCDVYDDNEMPELRKLVFPAKVKLNNSGAYNEKGTEYTITNVDISNGYSYNVDRGIQEMIFPNTVTTITLSEYYKYLEKVKLPNSLTALPYFNFEYDYNNSKYITPAKLKIPSSVTTISDVNGYANFNLYDNSAYCSYDGDDYKTYGETDDGITLYIPKEVTTIESDSIVFSNVKKFYVESKEVKNRLITAIEDYCQNNYSDYNECYSSSDSCVTKIKNRIVYDPTSF